MARGQPWSAMHFRDPSEDVAALIVHSEHALTAKIPAETLRTPSPIGLPATKILGVPISLLNMPRAVDTILRWVERGQSNYVCVRDVHGVMRAQREPELLAIHERAGMITPDGMPLVWIARMRGHDVSRVCGPDLVTALAERTAGTGVRHYFYGGTPGTAARMAAELVSRFPGLAVAGAGAPPFHTLSAEEDAAETRAIAAARPQIVWVGLGTPKQEYWMRDHVGRIPGATLIAVGASFDFYAGNVNRAPAWMHGIGLEWLHRLLCEPRRLWPRYLLLAPEFVVRIIASRLRR